NAVAVELGDQIVGHRLAEVGATMKKRDEGAAAGQPDRSLTGGVTAADHSDPGARAGPGLRRTGCVEDGQALELLEPLTREAPVVGAGGDHDCASDDLAAFLEVDPVRAVARLQSKRPVGRRRPRTELPRLGDRAARQLDTADPGRKAEVVLDPA